jgi:hypothetical protein
MAKAKSIAVRKKSSTRGKTSTKRVRKKMAKRTAPKARNSKSGARSLKAARKPKASKKLVYFEVDEVGTITSPHFKEPKTNSEIFDVPVDDLETTKSIIFWIEQGDAQWNTLVWHFRSLARDEHGNPMRRIELQDYRDDKELQRMKRLAKALEDEDDGWKEWIKIEGKEGAPRFKKLIVDWLAAPIEWEEDMPDNATAVGSAKHFFESEDLATLNKLDVWILEGDRPGSNYCAAVLGENLADSVNPEHALEKTLMEANEAAQKLGYGTGSVKRESVGEKSAGKKGKVQVPRARQQRPGRRAAKCRDERAPPHGHPSRKGALG